MYLYQISKLEKFNWFFVKTKLIDVFLFKILRLLDVDDNDNPLCLVAKEKRKEMWRAIDVNDNGYASLSEITRVGRLFSLSLYFN